MTFNLLPIGTLAVFLASNGAALACTTVSADVSGAGRHATLTTHGCVTLELFGRGAQGQVIADVASSLGKTRIWAMGEGAGGLVTSAHATGDLTIVLPMCPDGRPARATHLRGESGLKVARCR
jgi:hypothetical protein